ncbi:MAG: GLPGLI family protein [Flavobacteriaceae bacterium]|nr:GLPGLI family protein [Flavobacteriaceae bacterium]
MKSLFVLLVTLLTVTANSQSNFQGKAVYMSKTTMDMNFGGRQLSEEQKKRIQQRMKNMLEKTYTLYFNQTESTYKEDEKLGAPGGRSSRFGMMSFTGGTRYKNIKDAVVLEETEFFGKKFLISENGTKPAWKLSGDTKKIGNYICYKATLEKEVSALSFAGFGRRSSRNNSDDKKEEKPKKMIVTAWYTPQIPVSQGPAEYWGLPGLILEINADRTTVLCTEITLNPKEKITIKKPKRGKEVTREEYTKIVKKKMDEMREQFRGRRGGRGGRG